MQTAEEIERRLAESKGWPKEIRKWTVARGLDATGDDAVWVWIDIPEDSLDVLQRQAIRERVSDLIHDLVRASSPEPIAYVRFSSEDPPERLRRGPGR